MREYPYIEKTHIGPVEVSPEDLSEYKKGDWCNSFKRMYRAWINEQNPDGVRRLLIRELLRQFVERTARVTFCDTGSSSGHILRMGEGGKVESLYWMLHNRPKLLGEIVEEFLFNLDNGIVSSYETDKISMNELIEFLLSLASETDARRLWAYHPINQEGLNHEKKIKFLFDLYAPGKKMPKWLMLELCADIEHAFTADILLNSKQMEAEKHLDFAGEKLTIHEMLMYVYMHERDDGEGFRSILPFLWLLETRLPLEVECLDESSVIRLATKLGDEELALKLARRHVVAIAALGPDPDRISVFDDREGRVFLHWLRGIAVDRTPDDETLFEAIRAISSIGKGE